MKKVLVLGSINIDFVSFASRYPHPGETLVGHDFGIFQGGKGANQAIALAKLDIPTVMLGKVGQDPLKKFALSSLQEHGVDIRGISESPDKPTGSASIWVNDQGQNSIIIFPGANGEIDPDYVMNHEELFYDASYLLVQFEVPIASVLIALKIAKKHGLKTVVDPAPVREVDDDSFWKLVDYLIPNEIEIKELTRTEDILAGIHILKSKGVQEIIVKLGKQGACFEEEDQLLLLPSITPEKGVVDTTGAGDCFVAGFLYGLIQGEGIRKAIMIGNLVASYAVQKKGAAISFPKKSEIDWIALNE